MLCRRGVPKVCLVLNNSDKSPAWFAIRVTYSRELMVESYLNTQGVESYVPMYFAQRRYGDKIRQIWAPLIHNLIFIHATAEKLREIKAGTELPIRYIMEPHSHQPIVIPDKQMHDFMAVVATQHEHVEVIAAKAIELVNGDRVRVMRGMFAGVEGHYIHYKGHSKIAITVGNAITALTAYVPRRDAEIIYKENFCELNG